MYRFKPKTITSTVTESSTVEEKVMVYLELLSSVSKRVEEKKLKKIKTDFEIAKPKLRPQIKHKPKTQNSKHRHKARTQTPNSKAKTLESNPSIDLTRASKLNK